MAEGAIITLYGNTALSTGSGDKPLVTFALFAFNQERFVREAIEGAFAQTYSPLEIILTDDCSSDATPLIMEEMATAYAGPHKLIVRRGLKNVGTLSHVLHAAHLARGEIFVVAAGDDVSFPYRTRFTVEHLHGNDCIGFSGSDVIIDGEGTEQDWDAGRFALRAEAHAINPGWVLGATAAYKKELFDVFETIDQKILFEDIVISDTIELLGKKTIFSNTPLIQYRKWESNVFNHLDGELAPDLLEEQRIRNWKRYHDAKHYVFSHIKPKIKATQLREDVEWRQYNQLKYFDLISRWPNLKLSEKLALLVYAYRVKQIGWAVPRLFGKRIFFLARSVIKSRKF